VGLYITGTILVFVIVGVILIYNGLVQKSQMADNGWSDIDVQLKRRANLIPQLVNTVQGYATHERELFADIAEKRAKAMAAGDDLASRGAAESALSAPVARMMAVAEDYPDMKASQNFLDLQRELSDTEDKIEMARRFYNGAVRELNTRVQSFPANLLAGMFGFSTRGFFEVSMAERAVPKVDFGGAS
jgi:LemA protein